MDIKALKNVIVGTKSVPVKPGDIVRNVDDAEAKALIAMGYAAEAKGEDAKAKTPPANKAKAAPDNKGEESDPFVALLKGTVAEVTAALDGFDVDGLKKLRALETEGQGRKGILDAIAEYDLGEGE